MPINFSRKRHVSRIAALALVALNLFQLPVDAQSSAQANEQIENGGIALVGLARGDKLRFTAFNPSRTESGRRNEPITLKLKLYGANGNVIAESAETEIPPGEFRWVDFNRDDLPVAGDPGTARAQVRTQALWGFRARARFIISTSIEIVDAAGQTRQGPTETIKFEYGG